MEVLGGRFVEGEEAISESAEYSYLYAKDVLRGRFEMGESVIAGDGIWSLRYANDVFMVGCS